MSDRVCLVTGSTGKSGAGAAMIRHFAQKGWRVVVNYSRDAQAADVLVVKADVSRDDECREMARQIEQRWAASTC